MLSQNLNKVLGDIYLSLRFKFFFTISFSSKREQRMQLSFKVSCLVKIACVCTIMAFIMFSFIHFILKFRDSCKDYYSQLVVHSQCKITLSPVLVQAFLSQSICLLTNNFKCKFTFLFFLCLTYIFAPTHDKKHKLHHNHAFNSKSNHTPIFTKR